MNDIHLTYSLPDEQADALAGKLLDVDAFELLVKDDATVYKPDGAPLLKAQCFEAWKALRGAASESHNRGMAAGEIDKPSEIKESRRKIIKGTRYFPIKSDGSVSNTHYAKPVESGIVGFFDRNPRFPYCRLTAFNIDHYEQFNAALPFVYSVNEIFKCEAPEHYQRQLSVIEQTNADFYIHNTAFTTITVNRNFRTAVHKDKGDYKDGFGVMSVLQAGEYSGGYLCFPKYRIAVDMRTGGVCLADVHEWHGNTPIVGIEGRYERVSCVFYYRENMLECGSASEELERAKRRGTKSKVV